MAKTIDLSKMKADDIDIKFERIPQSVARKIDNGGTRPVRKKTSTRKKKK